MKALLALLPLLGTPLFGARPFTIEGFDTAANTELWSVYDYETRTINDPDWNAVSGGSDPEASTTFTSMNGVSLYADQDSSSGTFTGDYLAAGILGIDCDIYAEDATLIQSVEFSFLHDGVYYYSDPFTLNQDGWSILQYSFTADPWYYIDDDGFYVEEPVTDEMLSQIDEIGVEFFPTNDNSAIGTRVGVDYFNLIGQIPTPSLNIEGGNGISLSFSQEDGFSYTIQTSDNLGNDDWSTLSPETTDLTGSGTFSTTIPAALRQFLRINTRPIYYSVPDAGG